MFAKPCTHDKPRIDWAASFRSGKIKIGDTFTDIDGSTWQIQVDPDCLKVFPAKILDAPQPARLPARNCGKRTIGLKNL